MHFSSKQGRVILSGPVFVALSEQAKPIIIDSNAQMFERLSKVNMADKQDFQAVFEQLKSLLKPFEERLDGATDSLYAYTIGSRLFCPVKFRYSVKKDCGSPPVHCLAVVEGDVLLSREVVTCRGASGSASA